VVQKVGEGGRSYTSLGHRKEVWKDERFQSHLLGRHQVGAEGNCRATPRPAPQLKKHGLSWRQRRMTKSE